MLPGRKAEIDDVTPRSAAELVSSDAIEQRLIALLQIRFAHRLGLQAARPSVTGSQILSFSPLIQKPFVFGTWPCNSAGAGSVQDPITTKAPSQCRGGLRLKAWLEPTGLTPLRSAMEA